MPVYSVRFRLSDRVDPPISLWNGSAVAPREMISIPIEGCGGGAILPTRADAMSNNSHTAHDPFVTREPLVIGPPGAVAPIVASTAGVELRERRP